MAKAKDNRIDITNKIFSKEDFSRLFQFMEGIAARMNEEKREDILAKQGKGALKNFFEKRPRWAVVEEAGKEKLQRGLAGEEVLKKIEEETILKAINMEYEGYGQKKIGMLLNNVPYENSLITLEGDPAWVKEIKGEIQDFLKTIPGYKFPIGFQKRHSNLFMLLVMAVQVPFVFLFLQLFISLESRTFTLALLLSTLISYLVVDSNLEKTFRNVTFQTNAERQREEKEKQKKFLMIFAGVAVIVIIGAVVGVVTQRSTFGLELFNIQS